MGDGRHDGFALANSTEARLGELLTLESRRDLHSTFHFSRRRIARNAGRLVEYKRRRKTKRFAGETEINLADNLCSGRRMVVFREAWLPRRCRDRMSNPPPPSRRFQYRTLVSSSFRFSNSFLSECGKYNRRSRRSRWRFVSNRLRQLWCHRLFSGNVFVGNTLRSNRRRTRGISLVECPAR